VKNNAVDALEAIGQSCMFFSESWHGLVRVARRTTMNWYFAGNRSVIRSMQMNWGPAAGSFLQQAQHGPRDKGETKRPHWVSATWQAQRIFYLSRNKWRYSRHPSLRKAHV